MQRVIVVILAILCCSMLSVDAQADVLFDSGSVNFTQTGTQSGRLNRDGIVSTWSTPKSFPGVLFPTVSYAYELFSVNTGIYSYIQVSFDSATTNFFDSAYLASYSPGGLDPNYGFDVNYLGDPGRSGNQGGLPEVFQVVVLPNSNLVIVVNAVTALNSGGLPGGLFDLKIEGFTSAPVPEPTTLLLVSFGLVGLAGVRRIKK